VGGGCHARRPLQAHTSGMDWPGVGDGGDKRVDLVAAQAWASPLLGTEQDRD